MEPSYIERTLRVDDGHGNTRILAERELGTLQGPIIVLGDAGLGKTKLTESLETTLRGLRLTGGTFVRSSSAVPWLLNNQKTLIIDGLDEISASSGGAAVDDVLKKLSELGNPKFILSCRAADWQGSTDRYKIESDYRSPPTALHLMPFSYDDARQFLTEYSERIEAEKILYELNERNLSGFFGNPLTLKLVAELAIDGQGLPQTRAGLLKEACRILVKEDNVAHQRSELALSDLDELLNSAGGVFALLLLSGSIGVADRSRETAPNGYIAKGSLKGLPAAPAVDAVLRSRLFQSVGENLFIPIHRVIAEFLGARWLSKRLTETSSKRRMFQCLSISNGIPTPLRGLHAWLAYYNYAVAHRCIQVDPYGVLKYGETSELPIDLARLLLRALQLAADEDPYFRSEDWGAQAVAGLARRELKDEIAGILTHPSRHFHLSMLMLDALHGSDLTDEILPQLLAIVKDARAAYAERISAATAIWNRQLDVDWIAVVGEIRGRGRQDDDRLIVELMALTSGARFSAEQIADAIIEYEQVFVEKRREGYVSGVDRSLVPKLSKELCADILDVFVARLSASGKPRHWRAGIDFSSTLQSLIAKVISDGLAVGASRLWSWLKQLEDEPSYTRGDKDDIADFLRNNQKLRREIQRIAISDPSVDRAPWMAVVHTLPSVSEALALTTEDTIELLSEIAAKQELTQWDRDVWFALVRSKQFSPDFSDIEQAAQLGVHRDSTLEPTWSAILSEPIPPWKGEQELREREYREKRIRDFRAQRAAFSLEIERIRTGANLGALSSMANGYLGRYNNLARDIDPDRRLREWLDDELADAALAGFVAVLHRSDLPTAREISDTHASGKEYNSEGIVKCGVATLVRRGVSLETVNKDVLKSAMISWWHLPEPDPKRLGADVGEHLESLLLCSAEDKEELATLLIEPHLRANSERIPDLYRLGHNERLRGVAGKLALRWLHGYPSAPTSVQGDLVEIAIRYGHPDDLRALTRQRLHSIGEQDAELCGIWMSAAFAVDLPSSRDLLSAFCVQDPNRLWFFRDVIQPERGQRWSGATIQHLEFVVRTFADVWRPASFPSSGWNGNTNPWDASEFLVSCITAMGVDLSEEASKLLEGLAHSPAVSGYVDHAKHIRSQQRQRRWDSEFTMRTVDEIKSIFVEGVPCQVDDLRAMVLDRLDEIQDYIQNGDTNGWEMFWTLEVPLDENTCRNRLLDILRPRIRSEISLLPEITMPASKRVDINAIIGPIGLPIEIKGQWHPAVWDASSAQLDESYTRDWRANGRGVYLVLWFGDVRSKNLPSHPDRLEPPSSPEVLRSMLRDRLTESQRSRIDVVVLDLSKANKKPTVTESGSA